MIRRLLLILLFAAPLAYGVDLTKGILCFYSSDYECALNEFKPLAEQGDDMAQSYLGSMYYEGLGVKQDYFKAFEWTKKATEQGSAISAQFSLGSMYYQGEGVKQDYFKAFEWYKKAAEQGYDSAQHNLGLMYYKGRGVKQDYFKAFEWYKKAADKGHAMAQLKIGLMYDKGEGVKQDKSIAKKWYGKACDNKDQDGCDQYKYLNEQGVN